MTFLKSIEDRSAVVGVVGLGYVGLPLAHAFHRAGFRVMGFDVDESKVVKLNAGENYLPHLSDTLVTDMMDDRFEATSDASRFSEPDAIILCVPTPLGQHSEPDLSYIESTTDQVAKVLRPNQLVSLESTTYPGTTREVMLPRLEASGFRCGEDLFVAYSPEREDPGRKGHTTQSIPKLVGGVDARSGELATALYRAAIAEVIPVSSAEVAEAAKLLENIYRAVNIAMVNEMKVLLTRMGVDVWEVIEAAATKPFGFEAFYPGPGLGGHCIPIDPFYLTWRAREFGMRTRFIELAGEINTQMPAYVVRRAERALSDRGKAMRGSRILVLGLAYKKDVADVRESPSFAIIEELVRIGAEIDYNDPHIPRTHKMRRYDMKMESIDLTAANLASYDCVIISTDHSAYDWSFIADNARLVVDARGAMRGIGGEHIIPA